MVASTNRDEAYQRVMLLVEKFRKNSEDYLDSSYNETQARTEFITPLLEALGWDVYNTKNLALTQREVIEEATVDVGEEKISKKPDYELRVARQKIMYVEAKKPFIKIDNERPSAFQIRRYGYSASLPISILTNFRQLVVYDCIPIPNEDDPAHAARIFILDYKDFDKRFDELWQHLSREVILSGEFNKKFKISSTRRGSQQFDDFFLKQIRDWRERLAREFKLNNPKLSAHDLTYAVQLFISRLIFLRICEDRDIEKYATLRKTGLDNTFTRLLDILKRADKFYDSGIFRLLNDAPLELKLRDNVLHAIIDELYYPKSPYTFSVVDAEVLGEIYEIFLGEEILVDNNGTVSVIAKPEVRESGGIVPTPRYLADIIVEETLNPIVFNKKPQEIEKLTIADICCGSGIFLLSSFDLLLNYYLNWYLNNKRNDHIGTKIYEKSTGNWRITYSEKRDILQRHIRGIDIDSNAVEVARFSLFLKLIEDESLETLSSYVRENKTPALPELNDTVKCGNSLVSPSEWRKFNASIFEETNPFDWKKEFKGEMSAGGFSVIVGNPPYIRIQNMVAYSPREVKFYKSNASPYTVSHSDNFDKYTLFIERTLMLLNSNGRAGLIVPHKFMTLRSGNAIRDLLSKNYFVSQIIHFGSQKVFGSDISNYTCILILDKNEHDKFIFEQVTNIDSWRYAKSESKIPIDINTLTSNPWGFVSNSIQKIFTRIKNNSSECLNKIADIFVGLQTSADKIYIINPTHETDNYFELKYNKNTYRIEKNITKPFLHDVSLNAFEQPIANKHIIFPYHIENNKARLIQPDEFAKSYPSAWEYLNSYKSDLEKRKISGGQISQQQWYQYGRSQSLTKFSGNKIILPALSLEPRYAIDRKNIMVTGGGNGPYYLIRPKLAVSISVEMLLAILNHPFSEAIIRTSTSVFGNGYYGHGKQFIKNLPIPYFSKETHQEIIKLVQELESLLSKMRNTHIPQQQLQLKREIATIREEVEEKISVIFGLSTEDMSAILTVPVPE